MSYREMGILSWNSSAARVSGFSTAGLKNQTKVRIELTVTNPWELADIVRQLADLRAEAPAKGKSDA